MQERDKKKLEENKKLILQALSDTMKELRGNKSQFILSSENDIPISILSTAERGIKDPQLTTIFRIAEAYNLNIIEFLKKVCEKLPKDFEIIDK